MMNDNEYRDVESEMVLEEGQHVCMWYDKESHMYHFYLHEKPPYINQYIVNPRAFTFKSIQHSFVGSGWFMMGFDEAADSHEFQAYEKEPLATTSMSQEVLFELRKESIDKIISIVRDSFQSQINE